METPLIKWFFGETTKEILFHVPESTAQQRLTLALVEPKVMSKILFVKIQSYSGYMKGNEIFIDFTNSNRSNMYYSIYGQLYAHPNGCRLVVTITHKRQWLIILSIIIAITVILVGVKDWQSKVLLPVLFILISKVGLVWHRNTAAQTITEELSRIITGN